MLNDIKKLVSEGHVSWIQPHVGEAIDAYGLSEELVLEGIVDATESEKATNPEYRKISVEILGEQYFVIVEHREDVVFIVTIVFPTPPTDVKPSRRGDSRRTVNPKAKASKAKRKRAK